MKLAVEFPSVAYREGPDNVARLAKGIEDIGYDQLEMFDHVVMGYDLPGRDPSPYPAQMPIMEALTTLGFIAAVTSKIGLGTEVLVLPQRAPVLVAKQFSTLDTLSGGRVRCGVGIGWQASEYEALGENFKNRGKRMDEALQVLRACFSDTEINVDSDHYTATAIAMEPKPPQGAGLPIWIGGVSEPALKRVGTYGDGWLGARIESADYAKRCMDTIREAASAAGRDPEALGWQVMIQSPPRSDDVDAKNFYNNADAVVARAAELHAMGFDSIALNATAIFQSGARSVDQMLDVLKGLHDRLRAELG